MVPTSRSVALSGFADVSLCQRMRQAGLTDLVSYPVLITPGQPDSPIWGYREDHVLSLLSPDELVVWHAARQGRDRWDAFVQPRAAQLYWNEASVGPQ